MYGACVCVCVGEWDRDIEGAWMCASACVWASVCSVRLSSRSRSVSQNVEACRVSRQFGGEWSLCFANGRNFNRNPLFCEMRILWWKALVLWPTSNYYWRLWHTSMSQNFLVVRWVWIWIWFKSLSIIWKWDFHLTMNESVKHRPSFGPNLNSNIWPKPSVQLRTFITNWSYLLMK